jgi:hypothetical protein
MNVLHQDFEVADATCVATFFRDLPGASKIKASAPRGFPMRQTRLNVFLDLPLEMKAEFVIEFRLDGAAPEQRTQTE